MLVELLSTSNYVQFNIRLAHIIGLEPAIYINELLNINEKAIRKATLKGEMMKLDRDYIFSRTTLTPEKQLEIELKLSKIGLIIKVEEEPNLSAIDIGVLTGLIMAEDEELIKSVKKLAKVKGASKSAKRIAITAKMKDYIIAENEELRLAYFEWIDAVVAKVGWLSGKAISIAQQLVDDFANHNLDIALKVIEIAAVNGYKDMQWAINKYRENYKISYSINPVQLNIDKSSIDLGEDVF